MGAALFVCSERGKNAKEAFRNAKSAAFDEYGHGGYTGSIAEKDSFVRFEVPDGSNLTPDEFVEQLIDSNEPKIEDKYGPCGCIDCGNGLYLFFGYASC